MQQRLLRTATAPFLAFLLACSPPLATLGTASEVPGRAGGEDFAAYWYQGTAEITTYRLEQARYGEIHEGTAVAIFVTEDFSRSKHVKLDRPEAAGADRVKVLKLNLTKEFPTGVYPYSMMTSVFTPVDLDREAKTLKVTTSSQEWCGHTFEQINRTDGGYTVELRSYFESEGDRSERIGDAHLEDGLWTLIRLDPSKLPTGTLEMVPGTMFQRLRHADLAAQRVQARLEPADGDSGSLEYTVRYAELERTLSIRFAAAFPYEIESWKETYRSGFGPGARTLTTRAVAAKRTMLDYWRRNSRADAPLRTELGLD